MTENELKTQITERRKRLLTRGVFKDLLLLMPPVMAEMVIILLAGYSGLLSLLLTYFVLPMFYTVERRLRTRISGIGDPSFNYADGYKAFFASSQGGIFGIFIAFSIGFMLTLAFDLAFSFSLPLLCNMFPGARIAFDEISSAYMDSESSITVGDLQALLQTSLPDMTQPMTIYIGLSLFIPGFYGLFVSVDTHLNDHYLSTIVLPDIDLNIAASQSRAVARVGYRNLIYGERIKYNVRLNWPYYLVYTALYGVSLYGFSFLKADSIWLMMLIISATPALSLFFGVLLNYVVLANDYCVTEASSPLLLERLPSATRTSIYQTYVNPSYIHGQESASRGSFIPEPTLWESRTKDFATDSQMDTNPNDFYEPTPSAKGPENGQVKEAEPEAKETRPHGGVFDFSDMSDDSSHKEDR